MTQRTYDESELEAPARRGALRACGLAARPAAARWRSRRRRWGESVARTPELAAEAELVWSSAAGDHRWLGGSLPPGGGEELIAEGAVGTLRLRAARIDEVLRAVFALLLRESESVVLPSRGRPVRSRSSTAMRRLQGRA